MKFKINAVTLSLKNSPTAMPRRLTITFIGLLFLTLFSCNNSGIKLKANNVFKSVDYDKVMAYSYNGEGGHEIIDNGQLAQRIITKVQLTHSQVNQFTNLICDKSTYGESTAACFDPHLGVVFYKNNKPVAYISICLECNYLLSSIKIPVSIRGFSSEGSKKILEFEKSLEGF